MNDRQADTLNCEDDNVTTAERNLLAIRNRAAHDLRVARNRGDDVRSYVHELNSITDLIETTRRAERMASK